MLDVLSIFIGIVLTLVVVGLLVNNAEHFIVGYIWRQIPCVSSSRVLRRAVATEIQKYKNVKSVCEIGSGYGGLARFVARKCNVDVVAVENVWFTFAVSYVLSLFFCGNRVQHVCADAFEYLKNENLHFDVGLAYLGPKVNDELRDLMSRFDVLICLDVPMSNAKPVRVVDVGCGYTKFGKEKYPHKLFFYENR